MELLLKWGLPRWLSSKESTCQCRRWRFDPWVRKIPWKRKWQPTPIFLPGKSHGQRSLAGYSPWGYWRVKYNLATKQPQLLKWELPPWPSFMKGPQPICDYVSKEEHNRVPTATGRPYSGRLWHSCHESGTQYLCRVEYMGLSSSCLCTWILGWPFCYHRQNSGLENTP